MNTRHLILDWNGTLIDDLDAAVQGVNLVLEGQSLAPISRDVYRLHFGFPIQDFYARLGIDFGRISFAELGRQYLAHFNQAIRNCPVFPGTFELIDAAQRQGWSVSVLSASEKGTLESNLHDAGLLDHLDHVFGLEDASAKGKLDLARQLDALLGYPKDRALMVGDTEHDIEIAHALGWRAHSVSHGHQSLDRLTEIHPAVSTSLLDIVAANLLAPHHKDTTNA
jgi:phosphoglycolate phosphatase